LRGQSKAQKLLTPKLGYCRGRDDSHEPPPAQIRTSASTHTALLKDHDARQTETAVPPDAHRRTLGHADSCSESGACVSQRCSPPAAPFPPQPPQKVTFPCSASSSVLRRSPTSPARACPSCGFGPSRTGLRILPKAHWRSPGSRACCLVSVHGLLDYAGPDSHSRITRPPCCLPLSRNRVGILFFRLFEAQSPRPLTPPAYASKHISRCAPQN